MLTIKDQQETIKAQQQTIQALQSRQERYEGDNILFTDFAEQWLAFKKQDVGQGTYAKYHINYKHNIKPFLQGKTLTQIDVGTIQGLLNSLCSNKNLKPATMKIIRTTLNQIMKRADGMNLLKRNPIPFVSIPRGESDHKRALTKQERQRLITATKDERLWIIPYLLLGTGMRREELLALTWDDVDLERRQIHVHEIYTQDCYSKNYVGKTKTQKSNRYIAIDDELVCHLKTYQQQQFDRYGKRKFIIGQRAKDVRTTPTVLRDVIQRWRDKSGIADLTSHMFRHTYATVAHDAGIDNITIIRQLGHTTTKLLETTYLHQTTDKDQQHCANVISREIYG